jgi:hypothetical protein
MAYWMVVRSVYSCIVTLGVNIRICRESGVHGSSLSSVNCASMVAGGCWAVLPVGRLESDGGSSIMGNGRACAPHQVAGEHDPDRQGA